jgi:peptidoglycan/LPS O-acetylase OafA/YrhL
MKKDNYLYSLQVFRGFAAIMVVICHLIHSLSYFQNIHISVLDFIASIGGRGVDFFFILSGFIISYSVFNNKKSDYNFKKYIYNRIIRIYIPYLPIGIGIYILYNLMPDFSATDRTFSLIRSVTLIPVGNPALSVAWTLSFEMMFYVLFGLNFISHRLWNWFIGVWIGLIILFNYVIPFDYNQFIFLNPYNIEFMLGYILSVIYQKKITFNKNIILSFFCIFGIIFLFTKYYDISYFSFYSNFLFSITIFFGLYFSIFYCSKYQFSLLLILLGNASYSIYLIHDPLISIFSRLLHSNSNGYVMFLLSTIGIIVCCIIGWLYYFIFEQKIMTAVKKILIK